MNIGRQRRGEPTASILFLVSLIGVCWLSTALAADGPPVTKPAPPLDSPPNAPQVPGTPPPAPPPPPSRIDPGIERRPQTIPDPRSSVTPPNVDPKMTIDPEKAPPAREKLNPSSPPTPEPPTR